MPEQNDTYVPLYEFDVRVVDIDREGYYYPRWDRATPMDREGDRDMAEQPTGSGQRRGPTESCEHPHLEEWSACLAEGGTAEGSRCPDCGQEWGN